jgi:hypothetical protein
MTTALATRFSPLRSLLALLVLSSVTLAAAVDTVDISKRAWRDWDGDWQSGDPPKGYCRIDGRWTNVNCKTVVAVWIIVVAVSAGVSLLCCIGLCCFLCRRRRRNDNFSKQAASARAANPYQNPLIVVPQVPYGQGGMGYSGASQYPPPRGSYEPVSLVSIGTSRQSIASIAY